ncbi:variant erythrocyte surface antigen-1 family protein [Babesia caballi]|uniref:Variant erythrocyte surface antigen-1 family protein n=1 Tax=Babesia caballi TaxID=5871 RepID=A0AAV4LRB9_BABCB|nr:variant erythrocyte surface antigen-1 family protein [Babesia caballi]
MSEPKKSLTDPPTNLKEAIDWVLRVSGGDGMRNDTDLLATALTASIKKKPYEENDVVTKLLTEIKKDVNKNPTGPIKQLGDALKTFIGYKYETSHLPKWKITGDGIVTNGAYKSRGEYTTYTSAYYGSSWFTDVNSGSQENQNIKKKKAVQNFFTAIRLIYEGLTELYWKCKSEMTKNSRGNEPKAFLTSNGFSGNQLKSSLDANTIFTALQNFTEFKTAYNPPPTSLDAFRSQLEQNASTSPSKSPLAALYILATYAYVQSSSPATPSFAGYSGTAALAGGAYGLNFGGIATMMSALLA